MDFIRLLVLISLTLRVLLFFAGRFRMGFTDKILRIIIWAIYMGADAIALYALTTVSRQDYDDVPEWSLAFFWAPFLLNHLGGQDTVTGLSMEDNNSWLTQLFYLMVDVFLVGSVLCYSFGRHRIELLVSYLFMCVAGIIRHGEKVWALKYGSYESLEHSTGRHHYEQYSRPGNAGTVCAALGSMLKVHDMFAANNNMSDHNVHEVHPNVVELQLGLMHDDLYTRSLVLRTRTGLVLRCISMVCSSVSFVLFISSAKEIRRLYIKADIQICDYLFTVVFFMELCAMLIFMMSPWTWAWFKSHGFNRLAGVSWLLYSIPWPLGMEGRRFPSSMGQCNNMNMLAGIELPKSVTPTLMVMLGKLLSFFGVGEEKISSWLDKLIHTEYVRVDDSIMETIVTGIHELLRGDNELTGADDDDLLMYRPPREWKYLGPILHDVPEGEFGVLLLLMHMVTDVYLGTVTPRHDLERDLKSVCNKLSNYMMYLMVNQPSMLPMITGVVSSRRMVQDQFFSNEIGGVSRGWQRYENMRRTILLPVARRCPAGEDVLQELVDFWTTVLLYAAGRCPPALHAARLANGGELITVAWLLMAHRGIGDFNFHEHGFATPDGVLRKARCAYFSPRMQDHSWEVWNDIQED